MTDISTIPSDLMRIEEKLDWIIAHLSKPKKTNNRKTHEYTAEFEEIWGSYPLRAGGNSKQKAFTAYRMRQMEGVPITQMQTGTDRYRKYCAATGKLKTEYVMQASRFFGSNREYENEWVVPKDATTPKTNDDWSDKAKELHIEPRSGEPWSDFIRRVKEAMR
jgi:hypothetical protein